MGLSLQKHLPTASLNVHEILRLEKLPVPLMPKGCKFSANMLSQNQGFVVIDMQARSKTNMCKLPI